MPRGAHAFAFVDRSANNFGFTSPCIRPSIVPVSTLAATTDPMTLEEYGELLNLLLECERAGAKLLVAYCDELPPGSRAGARLNAVQRDEARTARC